MTVREESNSLGDRQEAEQARQMFQYMGMDYYLARTEKALETVQR